MKKIFVIFSALFFFIFLPVLANAGNSYYLIECDDANIPDGYYDDLNTDLRGENFRRELSKIIAVGYVRHNYETNNEVLRYTDADPNVEGNVICLYTGQSLDGSSCTAGGWDKEHVWAKSHGFPNNKSYVNSDGVSVLFNNSEPYSDAHHLRVAYSSTNRSRGESDHGEVLGNVTPDAWGNKLEGGVFEVRDEAKGDVARMMFYMATRYGFDGVFNLTLVEDRTTEMSSGNGRFGNLSTLLKWHLQDPVSQEEIYRNNVIYTKYQHNRNPYIDHPEYVSLAYPESDVVDMEKVNNLIVSINNLPSAISQKDENVVNNLMQIYNDMDINEKYLVSNCDKLLQVFKAFNSLHTTKAADFVKLDTKSSLKIAYNEQMIATKIDLRFGIMMPTDCYDEEAKYGILVSSSSTLVEEGICAYSTIDEFIEANPEYELFECDPTFMDDYYLFTWEIGSMNGHYLTNYTAIIYMQYADCVFFGHSISHSVVSLASIYLTSADSLHLANKTKEIVSSVAAYKQYGDTLQGDVEEAFFN